MAVGIKRGTGATTELSSPSLSDVSRSDRPGICFHASDSSWSSLRFAVISIKYHRPLWVGGHFAYVEVGDSL